MQDYLKWGSPLSLEQVFSSAETFSYPTKYKDGVVYLTQIKNEKSRSALMFRCDDETHCLTPAPYNVRTKISEYGGKSYWLVEDALYFCNQADQCLYKQSLNIESGQLIYSKPERLTPSPADDAVYMFSDIIKLNAHTLLAIVECEKPSDPDQENDSYIATIDLTKPNTAPVIIEQGADFYSNLVFDQIHNRLAWVQWQHPSMPWDANELYTAILSSDELSRVNDKSKIEFDNNLACVCQLHFASNGRLFFSADFKIDTYIHSKCQDNNDDIGFSRAEDFWNIHCCDFDSNNVPINLRRVTHQTLEFGYPHWQYGDTRIVQFDQNSLLTIGSAPTGDHLFLINASSLQVKCRLKTNSTIQSLSSDANGSALMVELPSDNAPRLIKCDNAKTGFYEYKTLIENSLPLVSKDVSKAEHIAFDCRDGKQAFGFYYPPTNSRYGVEKPLKAPPLIVMVHGGPTARAYGHFDIQKQFWTSRGFALFDVNHRGSSGYGRTYRDALYSQWGELDCSDIVDGIQCLIQNGRVDPQRVCIRGKSAGGYAVLRALTQYPDIFKVGACYYGIGNLATLADTTHKFEKHYTDRLIGEPYHVEQAQSRDSLFYQRSPIHKVSELKSAMIVFQGRLDKVVPREVAHEVITELRQAGIDHEYVEYEDEAHGFRQVNNNIDAWTKELAFYRRILAD